MTDTNFQNFEVPQITQTPQAVVPEHPAIKRNKLIYIFLPLAVFLVVLSILVNAIKGNQPKPSTRISVTLTPTPTLNIPVPYQPVQISSSSAFFSFVATLSGINNQLDNVDLQELPLAVPKIDLHVSFEKK
jgi:hypothetical protein